MEGLRQSCIFMRATTLVVLVTFTSLILHPVASAAEPLAGDNSSPVQPAVMSPVPLAALVDVDATLAAFSSELERGHMPANVRDKINNLLELIDINDNEMLGRFSAIESRLQSLTTAAVITQRHEAAVAAYRQDMSILRGNLQAIAGAETPAALQQSLAASRNHLNSTQRRRSHQPFAPEQLPFHVPAARERKPQTTAAGLSALVPVWVQLASHTLMAGMLAPVVKPQPEDLLASDEVQLTPAIRALAAELGNNPLRIFNWVSDSLEFVPSYGSIQGSQMTLETKKANAFDTASLLIALLRAADIPARYVYGTVEIPAAQVMNWVGGASTPESALKLLAQGGIPSEGLIQGGRISHIRMEHVWVEAWVDYYPSRGVVHRQGDSWVALDGSFKQYQYQQGLDLQQAATGFDAAAFVQQLGENSQGNELEGWVAGVDTGSIEATLEGYRQQLEDYVALHHAGATVDDVLGSKTIIPQQRDLLSMVLPYPVVARADSFARLPATMRHAFRYAVYASDLDRNLDNPVFVFERSLPALAGQKITLSFVPETVDDAALLESFLPPAHEDGTPILDEEWPAELPGYLIKLAAELRVDGEVVQRGGSFTLGDEYFSRMDLRDPFDGWQPVNNSGIAGSYVAIEVAGDTVSAAQLQGLAHRTQATAEALLQQSGEVKTDHFIGDMLYGSVLAYFSMLAMFRDIAARMQGIISYPLPSLGSMQTDMQVTRVFGLPLAVSEGGLLMDIDRSAAIMVDKTGDKAGQVGFAAVIGMLSSLLENRVPEQLLSTDEQTVAGVSAAQALMLANEQGQKIYRITSDNIASVLDGLVMDAGVRSDIQNAIAAGLQAMVHESPVSLGGWSGTGYIINDPETGAGAYRISGGANGGWISNLGILSPILTFWETWDVVAMGNKVSKFAKTLGGIGTIIGVLSFASDVWEKCAEVAQKIIVMGMMTAFIVAIASTLQVLALSPLGAILYSTVANFIASKFMTGIKAIVC